jgi:hypothetical protein
MGYHASTEFIAVDRSDPTRMLAVMQSAAQPMALVDRSMVIALPDAARRGPPGKFKVDGHEFS